MKFMRIPAAVIFAGIAVFGIRAYAQEPPDRRLAHTITVTGTGEAESAPDIAFVTVGVVTTGARAQDAAQANAALTTKVMDALKRLAIAEKDLQTSGYSVSPQYEQNPQPRREGPRIIGYHVSNNVQAKVRNLANVGKVIDAALEAGANNVHGVSFGLDAREKAESDALANAVTEARRKAEVLARAAGLRVTGVVQIQEGAGYRPMPVMETAMFRGGAPAQTPISPGELTISANVTVVFSMAGVAGADRGGQMRTTAREDQLRDMLIRRNAVAADIASLKTRFKGTSSIVRARVVELSTLDRYIEALSKPAESPRKAPESK